MLYLEPVTILVHVFSLTMVQPAVVPVRRVTERFKTFVFVLFPGRVRHLRLQNFVRESPTNRKWLESCRNTIFYVMISQRLCKKHFRTQINGWQKWVSLIIIVFKELSKKLVLFLFKNVFRNNLNNFLFYEKILLWQLTILLYLPYTTLPSWLWTKWAYQMMPWAPGIF